MLLFNLIKIYMKVFFLVSRDILLNIFIIFCGVVEFRDEYNWSRYFISLKILGIGKMII